MKNLSYIFLLFIGFAVASCEDVVDVDLSTAAPRLVIDASINWQKGTSGNQQKIKLSTTTGYYQTTVPPVSGAVVFITDSNNTVFNFTETPGTGEYTCNDFVPALLMNYTLTVISGGQTYTASETLHPVPPIDQITQRNDGGFVGDEIEIKVFYTDSGATNDFYMIRYTPGFAVIPIYSITDDEFFQGNQISDFYFDEELDHGDTIGISLYGISQQYYNYMNVLTGIVGGGGPFQSPPANLKGNLVNTTDFDNYALGYFSVSEVDSRDYVIE